MTTAKHTPAYTDKRFDVHEGNDYVVILGPHDTTDAPAARVYGDTTEETLYFAHLMAAAPKMLKRLNDAREHLNALDDKRATVAYTNAELSALISAVIAEAEQST